MRLRSVNFMFNSKRYIGTAEFRKAFTRKDCEWARMRWLCPKAQKIEGNSNGFGVVWEIYK